VGGEPTFRVGGKNFVFASTDATTITVKSAQGTEAAAVIAHRLRQAAPTATASAVTAGSLSPSTGAQARRWAGGRGVDPTSYALIAPRKLARQVLDQDQPSP